MLCFMNFALYMYEVVQNESNLPDPSDWGRIVFG